MRIQSLLKLVFAVFYLVGSPFQAFAQAMLPKASEPRPAMTVTVTRAQTQNLSQRISANGTVAAWQEASIGAEIGGLRLTEVRVNVATKLKQDRRWPCFPLTMCWLKSTKPKLR
jgi:multidrug efflux pump subunit AcrA (membrane-fusion protein)